MNEHVRTGEDYRSLVNDFQQFLQQHLDHSHPCVVNFCFQETMDFMVNQTDLQELSFQHVKTETLKQKKALESILDLMQWNEKYQPSIHVLETAISKLTTVADLFPVDALTEKDFSAGENIYNLPDQH